MFEFYLVHSGLQTNYQLGFIYLVYIQLSLYSLHLVETLVVSPPYPSCVCVLTPLCLHFVHIPYTTDLVLYP